MLGKLRAFVGEISLIVGVCFSIWWKLDAKIRAVEKELSDTKLHMAESYISKAGHRETTDQILRAIEGLSSRIDSLFTTRRSRGSQE